MNWGRYHVETGTAFTWIHSLCVMFMSLNNGDLKNRPESVWTTSRFRSGIGVFCSKFHVHLFNSTFWKSSLFIWEIITNKCPTAWSKLRCSFILFFCVRKIWGISGVNISEIQFHFVGREDFLTVAGMAGILLTLWN